VTYQEPPPSIELKRYLKETPQLPSSDEVARLARGVYQDDTEKGQEVIMDIFSQRCLSKLLLQEEKRKSALGAKKCGAAAVEATAVRVMNACAAKDAAVHTKAGLYCRLHASLKHI
jgi:hypothetical protein